MKDHLGIAKRYRWPIMAALVLSMLASLLLGRADKPEYAATAELLFSVNGGNSATDLNQASTYLERQMTSYSKMVLTPIVLDPAIKDMKVDMAAGQLAAMIGTEVPTSTTLLDITVTADDPAVAAKLANGVANSTAEVVGDISPAPKDSGESVKATVISKAVPPASTGGLGTLPRLVLGLLVGLALSVGLVALLRSFDRRLYSIADLRRVATDVPVLTGLAPVGTLDGVEEPQRALQAGNERAEEGFRRVRSSLRATWPRLGDQESGNAFTMAVTSPRGGDAAHVSRGIARSLAEGGRRVLHIDADLRRSGEGTGFGDLLTGHSDSAQITTDAKLPELSFLSSGSLNGQEPGAALGGVGLPRIIAALGKDRDVVILSAPGVGVGADAEEIARVADGTVLTVELGRSRDADVSNALERVGEVSAVVLLAKGAEPLDA